MKIVLQLACVYLFAQVALAAKGPVSEPVCDVVCPDTYPIQDNWHIPYTSDCTKFCHCANDGNWKKDCPPGLHFNKNLQVCDWPEAAGCVADASTAAPTAVPTAAPTAAPTVAPTSSPTAVPSGPCDAVCPPDFPITDNLHLPFPGDCTKFCHCANDGKWEKDCPAPLHFNAELQVCDWAESAGCDNSTSTGSSPAPTTATTHAPATGCEHVTCGSDDCFEDVNTLDCQKYCKCDHGSVIVKECSNGLFYNPETGNCDWADNVKCEGPATKPSTSEKPTDKPAPASECDAICPAVHPIVENNHLRYPSNCAQFCHCANDGNWLKDCPAGLHFNAVLQVCDWPNAAKCIEVEED